MKKLFIITLFCCMSLFTQAQLIDTIQSAINQKSKMLFNFDSRNSFITNSNAHIFGCMVGVMFGTKISIGGGINWLTSPIYKVINEEGVNNNAKLSFTFMSYTVEYSMNLTSHWKLYLMPVNIGIGGSNYQYTYNNVSHTIDSYMVMLCEPGVELDFNFNKYWGLYTQVCYRFMLVNNPVVTGDFNSPTYSFGVFFAPFDIYTTLFPHTKLAKIIEEY